MSARRPLTVAVNGCSHGELDVLYETLQFIETSQGVKADLLLCCGDFEAIRDQADLACMNVPPRYRKMGSFASFLDGTRTAPVLTVFVGGNHEASNHLAERYHGGWLAPNIYFLGIAGVISVNGVRIAGLSGIFSQRDFDKGHYEAPPYSESELRSVYHVRSFDVMRLNHLSRPLDVFLSHDWPRGIYRFGDFNTLFRWKQHLSAERDEFGSPVNTQLLHQLRPTFWFCGHMHVKFAAVVPHTTASTSAATTDAAAAAAAPAASTYFLALDKIGPRKQFMQLVNIAPGEPPNAATTAPAAQSVQLVAPQQCVVSIDREWLAIVHATRGFYNGTAMRTALPSPAQSRPLVAAARKLVDELIRDDELIVPPIFFAGAPSVFDMLLARLPPVAPAVPLPAPVAPPSDEFADDDRNEALNERLQRGDDNDEEIALPDEEDEEEPPPKAPTLNLEAIDLPDDDDEVSLPVDDDGARAATISAAQPLSAASDASV